jgi:alkyl hydroperoxide reductase subunit AhpC
MTIGQKFPSFDLEACISREKGKEFKNVPSAELRKDGKWMVIFFWPGNFTFVRPAEIKGFNDRVGDFRDRDADCVLSFPAFRRE